MPVWVDLILESDLLADYPYPLKFKSYLTMDWQISLKILSSIPQLLLLAKLVFLRIFLIYYGLTEEKTRLYDFFVLILRVEKNKKKGSRNSNNHWVLLIQNFYNLGNHFFSSEATNWIGWSCAVSIWFCCIACNIWMWVQQNLSWQNKKIF